MEGAYISPNATTHWRLTPFKNPLTFQPLLEYFLRPKSHGL